MHRDLIERREFIRALGLCALGCALPGCGRSAAVAGSRRGNDRPSFVFIMVDDLGWRDAGFMGSTFYETPNIDRLAGEGMVFTDAYANAPNCAPSRACLMSGQYSPRHGVYTVGTAARGEPHQRKLVPVNNRLRLDPAIVTLAESLRKGGYVCGSFGKWHLGEGKRTGPLAQGFDVNVAGDERGHIRDYFSPYGMESIEDGPVGEYMTDRLTDEALAFIDGNRGNPFFLYLPHYAVHTPIQARKELIAKYRARQPDGGQGNPEYAAMIESVDTGVGRIMERLEKHGLTGNTVVVFFSDNGGHGKVTSNAPLRGAKGMLYEGGIRVPLAVRWPGHIPAGRSCGVPVIGTDFYPTFLEIAGIERPAGQVLDGVSMVPLFEGAGSLGREAIYWHFPAYLEGDSYEGARDSLFRTRPAAAVRSGEWKLIEFYEDNALELYNLREDIGERNNLAGVMPGRLKQMHQRLLDWQKETGAFIPSAQNPAYDPSRD